MEWAWTSGESDLERFHNMEIAQLQTATQMNVQEYASRRDAILGIGKFIGDLILPFAAGAAKTKYEEKDTATPDAAA